MAHHLSAHAYVPNHRKLKNCIIGWSTLRVVRRNYTQFLSVLTGCGCAERCKCSKCCKAALCENKPVQNTTHKLCTVRLTKTYSKQQTACSAAFLEKPAAPQPVNKFPAFYGTRMFIAVCTTVQHLSPSEQDEPTISRLHPLYLKSISILSSHLRLRSSSSFLPSCCPPKTYNFYFKQVSCSQ